MLTDHNCSETYRYISVAVALTDMEEFVKTRMNDDGGFEMDGTWRSMSSEEETLFPWIYTKKNLLRTHETVPCSCPSSGTDI
ncbi:hypothetical protein HAX54_039424 [Datura stramonium]|uniref:Uncharacterized protein n=1 Tax=Datura stramonium TaxID=4076 RepID=A0ABS8SJ76_DATST|nr:hypothetical protein [Datura stramonium]